ncbi:MAG: hypothetical protein JWN15_1099, partial [Firmicutes bacterium]|nr:hypothetical protein [Bacillota bacterium]
LPIWQRRSCRAEATTWYRDPCRGGEQQYADR